MRRRLGLIGPLSLLAWSGFLFQLWLSGDLLRYVGLRTWWVVPFGAFTLGAVGLASLVLPGARGGSRGRSAAALLFPIAAAVIAAPPELGSYAASRKAPPPLAAKDRPAALPPVKRSGLTMYDLYYASQFDDSARRFGVVAGTKAEALGFVTHPKGAPRGTFAVTRFFVWCCVADAEPLSAQIDASRLLRSDYPDDTWLRVEGVTRRRGRRIILAALTVESIDRPRNPYGYP